MCLWTSDITSDCGAVDNVQNDHGYTPNASTTVKAVLEAGMDTDCGNFMGSSTMSSLLDDSEIATLGDEALKNLFRVQLRLGFADPPEMVPFGTVNASVVDTPDHRALAKEAADQSLVLLKNDANTLPLNTPSAKTTVAVIGRNAAATGNMQGNYFGTAPFLISPVAGIGSYAKTVTADGSDVAAAVAMAEGADAVVLVVRCRDANRGCQIHIR